MSITERSTTMLTPGTRLRTTATTTEVVVVRPADVALTCAGAPMSADAEPPTGGESDVDVLLGKRYRHPASGLEVLCVAPGAGPLSADGVELNEVESKPLPASD